LIHCNKLFSTENVRPATDCNKYHTAIINTREYQHTATQSSSKFVSISRGRVTNCNEEEETDWHDGTSIAVQGLFATEN